MKSPRYPALYQINTRVWLTELSRKIGRHATLDDIPDDGTRSPGSARFRLALVSERLADGNGGAASFSQQSRVAARVSGGAARPGRGRYRGLWLRHHRLHGATDLGGDAALARLRERLSSAACGCCLDFVPNHTGLDHPWVERHPEYYVAGTEVDLAAVAGELRSGQSANRAT